MKVDLRSMKLPKKKAILPPYSWLRKNGYDGLSSTMKKYPDLFRDFEQDKLFKTVDEWVKVAEELAYENRDGELEEIVEW